MMKKEKTILNLALLLCFLSLTACIKRESMSTLPSTEIYIPSEPIPHVERMQTAWSHLPDGDKWTHFTQSAIGQYGQNLLLTIPRDIARYCPTYPRLNRERRGDFWVHLIAKLAALESSYNPQESYTENFPDNNGNNVVSRGLLQISKESANGNYHCGIGDERELHDPKINLECGVRILNRWIKEDGVIVGKEGRSWRGAARYWSPFRSRERNKKIAEYTRSLSFCQ